MISSSDMAPRVRVTTAVSFYWIVSISLVFLNKVLMSGELVFDSPLFLTWLQTVIAVLCCIFLSVLKDYVPSISIATKFEYKLAVAIQVLPLTLIFVGMVVFNNLCLRLVEVSFYQVARSLTIVFNVLLSRFVLKEKFSYKALLSVFLVLVGYLIGCDGEVKFSWLGAACGICASFFVALYSIYVKRVFKIVKNDSWLLVSYNNLNAIVILPIIIIYCGESQSSINFLSLSSERYWFVIMISGIFGYLINIATYLQIEVTSPLSHNVSGTAKAGIQSFLAYLLFGNKVTLFSVLGLILTLAGSLSYSYFRLQDMGEARVEIKHINFSSRSLSLSSSTDDAVSNSQKSPVLRCKLSSA